MKKLFALTALFLLGTFASFGQQFSASQRSQERIIRSAYKRHRVTPNEYAKLMREQETIRYAIGKYAADGIWTPHEKEVVAGKLARAEKRIHRYKTNGERY
ncbi:hypothetical protein ACTHGU_00315 [Chitinophagaceae bacterium MMS25-I14]